MTTSQGHHLREYQAGRDAAGPERAIVERWHAEAEGISFTVASEDVTTATDWCFQQPQHMLVVHLAGRLSRLETVFSDGPSSDVLPSIGDIWAIPAGSRYAALAHGDRVRYAEWRVPTSLVDGGELAPRVSHRDQFLHHATERMASLAGRSDDLARMMTQSLLATMRCHIADAYLGGAAPGERKPAQRRFSDRQRRALVDHIADRLRELLTIAELAAVAGVSVRHLSGSFKASFGMTPWQYVLKLRLAEAARLLKAGGDSVTVIAAAVGFSSASHFATSFGQHFGISPAAFRRTQRGHGA